MLVDDSPWLHATPGRSHQNTETDEAPARAKPKHDWLLHAQSPFMSLLLAFGPLRLTAVDVTLLEERKGQLASMSMAII